VSWSAGPTETLYGGQVLGCNAYELSGYLKRRVAIAIQRGNAALDRAGLQLSRNSYGASVASGMVAERLP
jgi:hypothetical protein